MCPVARSPQPCGRAVARVAQRRLGRGARHGLASYDLRPEHLGAEARVGFRLVAAQAVVHVDGRHAVAELAEDVPEARRVRSARDEAGDLAAGGDQLVAADRLFDAICEGARHAPIVPWLPVVVGIAEARDAALHVLEERGCPLGVARGRAGTGRRARSAPCARPGRGPSTASIRYRIASAWPTTSTRSSGRASTQPQPAREAGRGLRPALAAARRGLVGRMRRGPGAVRLERPAVEGPEVDLVELGLDDDRDVAAVERRARASPACGRAARSARRRSPRPR